MRPARFHDANCKEHGTGGEHRNIDRNVERQENVRQDGRKRTKRERGTHHERSLEGRSLCLLDGHPVLPQDVRVQ